ncbi:MAG TPA: hypothetical protein VNO81_13230, partial [Candidatus Nitrosotenuis sp.]|nr:hypothetical protein [Candidatus Nitrosotenuis sp.]
MRRRLPRALLLPAILCLLAGVLTGLARLGFRLPAPEPGSHGLLMVAGFLGTLIGLERAVALGRRWPYAGPALTGLSALALLAHPGCPWATACLVAGSALLGITSLAIRRLQPSLPASVQVGAALLFLGGTALWAAGWPRLVAALWWTGFLVLTIAAERLELSRLTRPHPGKTALFTAALALLVLGLGLALPWPEAGQRLAGVALIALAGWLFFFDVARRTVRLPGLPRFIAICILAGYAWLGAGGLILAALPSAGAGPLYDAALHALFLGFVFSMIFAHAPVVLPALAGVAVSFQPRFYVHLALLEASLALRLAGDLLGIPEL